MSAVIPGHSNADLARVALLTPQTMSVMSQTCSRPDS
jgi:hypothetical protein